jgi:bifunctional enzyme CysN/CysC
MARDETASIAASRTQAVRPCVLWFTGLSCASKSTVANIVGQKLFEHGRHTE